MPAEQALQISSRMMNQTLIQQIISRDCKMNREFFLSTLEESVQEMFCCFKGWYEKHPVHRAVSDLLNQCWIRSLWGEALKLCSDGEVWSASIRAATATSTEYRPYMTSTIASRFDFYSFSGYKILISTIQFSLVKMLILDIRNLTSTSNNGYSWYQELAF